MILRRLYAIQRYLPSNRLTETITVYKKYLLDFHDNSFPIKPYREKIHRNTPERWSTKPGPHQVKIASLLLFLDSKTDPILYNFLFSLYSYWKNYLISGENIQSTHSLLYYLEGVILIGIFVEDRISLHSATKYFKRILNSQTQHGFLPSDLHNISNHFRSDVQAQALRIGAILNQYGYLDDPADLLKLNRVMKELTGFIDRKGAVNFYPLRVTDSNNGNWNTWCSMFTYQAILYFDKTISNSTIHPNLIKLLI